MKAPAPCIAMDEMVPLSRVCVHEVPVIEANAETFAAYGRIVRDFAAEQVIIATWPAPGWRRVEPGTGNEGGITSGDFVMYRQGDLMVAHNHAVSGSYVTGWFADPALATAEGTSPDYSRVLVREANYHPDGGQVFYPRNRAPFMALLGLPGDDVTPEDFVAFRCDGTFGIQIFPNVWHQPMFPLRAEATFDDKQGRVHACIAVDFVKEFGCYLSVPLGP
jgi:ureidoglycolate hydrolase